MLFSTFTEKFGKFAEFTKFIKKRIKRPALFLTAVSVSALYPLYLASCAFLGTGGGSGGGLSQGLASEVNGFIINKGDIITEIGEYSGGGFRKLSENRAQIDFDTGTYLNNITIDLTYYEDKQNKIYISGSYAQINAKNYTAEYDFTKKEGYTPLYSVAYDRNTIALAVMIDGVITTILADLDKNAAEYLIPFENVYDQSHARFNQPFIQCLPVEITDGGNTLLCLETVYNNGEYLYYAAVYGNVFEKNNSNLNRNVFSQIKIPDADNFYCGIVNKNAQTAGETEIIAGSGKSGGDISGIVNLNGSPVNAKAIESNIYCPNFLDFDKTEDYLEFREIGKTSAKKYDLGFKIDNGFKKSLSRSNKYFILNPSRTKAAVLYKNVIYIMDLTLNSQNSQNPESPNRVKKIITADYGSSWDADDAIVFIDDKTVIFNAGTTDNDGRMATVPKFIDTDED